MVALVSSLPECGDIVMVKSHSLIGWAIGTCFRSESPLIWHDGANPLRPSNHTGIIGFSGGQMYVYESLAGGFVRTPWRDYCGDVLSRRCELKIGRVGLGRRQKRRAQTWLDEHVGVGYDYLSYASHLWRVALRLPPLINVETKSRFYCTEAAKMLYASLEVPFLEDNDMPTPYTVEKRVVAGQLKIVAEYWTQKD